MYLAGTILRLERSSNLDYIITRNYAHMTIHFLHSPTFLPLSLLLALEEEASPCLDLFIFALRWILGRKTTENLSYEVGSTRRKKARDFLERETRPTFGKNTIKAYL